MATVTRTPVSAAPKLKKISDRKIHIVTTGPVVEGPPGSECSKEPASPCKTAVVSRIPKFSAAYMAQRHPSIEIIGDRLRECSDIGQFRALASVFSTAVNTNILHSFDQLPFIDVEEDEYRARRFFIVDTCRQFLEQSNARVMNGGSSTRNIIAKALALLDLIFEAMNDLVHVAEQLFNAGKPLPPIPEADDNDPILEAESPISSNSPGTTLVDAEENETSKFRKSLHVIVEEVLAEDAQEPSTPSSASFSIIEFPDKKVHFAEPGSGSAQLPNLHGKSSIGHRLYLLQKVVQRSKSSITLRSFTSSKSAVTYVELELEDGHSVPWKSEESLRSIKTPYSLRQSCLYQFYDDEERVDMPMPKVEGMQVDNDGRLMESTLEGLVLHLTSNIVLEKPELLFFFFNTFRYFCEVKDLADLLERRFHESAPEDLSIEQTVVWHRSNKGTKFRVRNFIQTWVHSYWHTGIDDPAVSPLLNLSLGSMSSLDDGGTVRMFSDLLSAARGYKSRQDYLKVLHKAISEGNIVPTPRPTDSKLAPETSTTFAPITGMKMFVGHEINRLELVRQLTSRSGLLFSQIDCDEAVKSWFEGGEMKHEVKEAVDLLCDWNRRLSLFVTQTILNETSQSAKRAMIEFWLDVSMDCLNLANMDGALAVFSGITTSAVNRMKRAILSVSANHKYNYRVMDKLFFSDSNFRNYRHVLTGLREKVVPHVPLLDPFKKDLSGAQAVRDLSARKENAIIRLGPYYIVHNTLEAMQAAQIAYKYQSSPSIQVWLDKCISPFGIGSDFDQKFYEQSVLQYPRGSDPDFSQLDPWQFTLSGKKIEPLLPLRIDLEKIFAINKYDPEPERSKERRRAVAMYKVSIIPALK